ncbi:hypothetical protein QHH11_28915, partial [Aphanizomenon sp. PH219]|nr:hypothetical protein [Aphanizomenon sp. PH219]
CKSSNPGHPDSDKIISTSSKTILPSHPVNPQILDILIQTKSSQLPTNNHPTTSCKSSNPGHPDSDKIISTSHKQSSNNIL